MHIIMVGQAGEYGK